ncbi:hypothetical protein DI392_05480 [Vibrio albus]|uniref:Polysaccharide biosynthesis protein n=1 Tax=Vibrio albus TaxID=2200953 RepID=A0A2U3BCP8_9VIBR|nr:oligosaccharide flippase family protein [Vibrio albus]PWI34558.1 hypothetical protein DI392_05480 [Vibrio albus]
MIEKLLKKSTSLLLGTGSTALANLITVPLLISAWGMADYGSQVTILALTMVFMTLFNFQPWQGVIVKWYNESESEKNKLLSFTIHLDLITAISGSVLLFILAPVLAGFMNLDDSCVNIIKSYSVIIFMGQVGFSTVILRITENFKKQALCQISYSISRVLIAIYITAYDVDFYIGAQLLIIPYVIQNMLFWIYAIAISHEFKYKFNVFKLSIDCELLKYSAWVNFKAILDLPINHIDKLLISMHLGTESTAVYDLLKKGGQIFAMVAQSVSQVSFPYFSKLISEGRKKDAYSESLKIPKKVILPVVTLILLSLVLNYTDSYNSFCIKGVVVDTDILLMYFCLMLLSNSFIFIHVLFMSMGYIKKDVAIMIVASFVYLLLLNILISVTQLSGVIFSLFVQIAIVVTCKVLILKKEMI